MVILIFFMALLMFQFFLSSKELLDKVSYFRLIALVSLSKLEHRQVPFNLKMP